jgi:hypothetical protein
MRLNVPKTPFAAFTFYVAAIKKRLLHHFGITYKTSARWIDQYRDRVHQWHMRGIPADQVARILYDAQFSQHTKENPIPNWGRSVLMLASVAAMSTGVYFFWQSLQAEVPAIRPTVRPDPLPSFPSPSQEIIETAINPTLNGGTFGNATWNT